MIARPIRFALASLVTLALASCNDSSGPGDHTLPPDLTLKVDPFVSGLSSPVFLTQPLNDGRIFVVEQAGRIRVVKDGVLQATPFLNISTRVLSGGERGLLSVAFHPQYATNHYFYVYFTTQTTGDIRIERFTTTANADVADPATSKLIFTTPHPNSNHNGGLVSFGPDGMLYAALGDGGGSQAPDQDGNGQNFNAYLGGMIRIDINGGDPYAVPPNNPFVGQANKKPELWAKGFRNPWRYAFDPTTSMLYIADVGESAREEVDVVAARDEGLNFGWRIMEGSSCFGAATCNQTGLEIPILDYSHANGACSITGGYVYRGAAIPAIQGHYFYSDYCSGFLKSFRYENGVAVEQTDWGITMNAVSSFGKDFAGELYIMTGSNIVKVAQGT